MALTPLPKIYEHTTAAEIREAVAAGADVNARDGDGFTPLHYANDAEQTRLLLDAGAKVNARDDDGWTPLHFANDAEQARALLTAGVKIPNDLDERQRQYVAMASAALRLASQPDVNHVGPTQTADADTDADSDGWAAIRAHRARGGGRSRS